MLGTKLRIDKVDFKCIGSSCGNWVFSPLNLENGDSIILNDSEVEKLKEKNKEK